MTTSQTTQKTPLKAAPQLRSCKVCGCSDLDACFLPHKPEAGNCCWVAPDLCSHCKSYPGEGVRYSIILDAEAAAGGAFAD